MISSKYLLILLILISFIIRLFPIDFPVFSADEARVAVRGYTLAKYGNDELGRKFPLIFNSSEDYQLPITSYLTAVGIFIFGKNDFGSRMPFILIGTILIFYIYNLSQLILERKYLNFYAAIIACFSPSLIYFSKFPNEYIVAALLFAILLSMLFSEKINKAIFLLVICLMLLTSKIFWLSLIPIIVFAVYKNKNLSVNKTFILSSVFILNITALIIFTKIPQGIRSLIENNFAIINDIKIKNGIERLRSQHLSYWPTILDKILFSKINILIAAFSNLLSHFQLGVLFGQLDKNGDYGFLNSGIFSKIAVIPFFIGIFKIIQEKKSQALNLLILILLVALPLLFVFPDFKIGFIVISVPLIILIIAFGFKFLSPKKSRLILFFFVLEIVINYLLISSSIKNSYTFRPFWIKEVVSDIYNSSLHNKVYISDNVVSNIIPFIEWYTPIMVRPNYNNLNFPYKFYEMEILNIKTIGNSTKFFDCNSNNTFTIFASKRDIDRPEALDSNNTIRYYKNDDGRKVLELAETKKCIE